MGEQLVQALQSIVVLMEREDLTNGQKGAVAIIATEILGKTLSQIQSLTAPRATIQHHNPNHAE